MQKYPRFLVSFLLGERGIVQVNPTKLGLKIASSKVEYSIFSPRRIHLANPYASGSRSSRVHPLLRRFFLPHPLLSVEVLEWKKFLTLKDYFENLESPKRSKLYALMIQKIEKHGVYKHKNDKLYCEADVKILFEQKMKPLFETMRDNGYDTSIASDIGAVFIDSDGRLVKGSGADHRFCAARLVGLQQIPLRVQGVSQDWYAREVGQKMDVKRLGEAIARAAQRTSK